MTCAAATPRPVARFCFCCNAQCAKLATVCPYVIPYVLWRELMRLQRH